MDCASHGLWEGGMQSWESESGMDVFKTFLILGTKSIVVVLTVDLHVGLQNKLPKYKMRIDVHIFCVFNQVIEFT